MTDLISARRTKSRIIRPVEWEGCRFAVGCETEGVRWLQTLADAHIAQHYAELGIVPKEICHLTRATEENVTSPQVKRILRSDGQEAAIAATVSRPGSASHSLTKLGTVQSLVKAYEVRLGRTSKVPEVPGAVASDPAIEQRYFSAFEEASAAIMRGGDLTPPSGQVRTGRCQRPRLPRWVLPLTPLDQFSSVSCSRLRLPWLS